MAAADDDLDDDFSDEPSSSGPRPRNTGLTVILCLLNVLAALGFMYVLMMDYQKRSEWAYGVFLHDLGMQGLPLKEEEDGPSASRATMRYPRLSPDQIKAAFSQRPGTKGGGEFMGVDEDLVAAVAKIGVFIAPAYIHNRIQPSHMTPEILKDHFEKLYLGADKEVTTLEAEVLRLKDKVPADIAALAKDTVAKAVSEADKRKLLHKLALPLCYDVHQVDKMYARIQAAKGADVDPLLDDVVQRRVFMDILGPWDMYRPGDVKTFLVEKVADVDSFPLDDLKSLFTERCKQAVSDKFMVAVHQGEPEWASVLRTSMEKRSYVALMLAAVAFARKPDESFLYAVTDTQPGTPSADRAQRVVGVMEFAAAAHNLTVAFEKMQEKVVESILGDRQGYESQLLKKRSQSFLEKHRDEILRLKEIISDIRAAEERLKDAEDQRDRSKKLLEERQMHLEEVAKKLIANRAKTIEAHKDLRKLQLQLFQARVDLADAEERNLDLLKQINAGERKLQGKKAVTP